MKKIRIFSPAFNVEGTIGNLCDEFADVEAVLRSHGIESEVLIINDRSRDKTAEVLAQAQEKYAWLQARHNPDNLGNAANIIAGYQWAVQADADVVGCMDADGEHSPYALVRHLRMIQSGQCDGVVGSIIFPDHDASYDDRNMMRYHGGVQASLAGVDGKFYIQSPGYNLHQSHRVREALDLFEEYKNFFLVNTQEEFPRWGLHGVMIYLLSVGTGARLKAAYLECFGQSPNRSAEKLVLQAGAAQTHETMLSKFLPRVR